MSPAVATTARTAVLALGPYETSVAVGEAKLVPDSDQPPAYVQELEAWRSHPTWDHYTPPAF